MSQHDTRSVIRLGDVDLSGVEAEIGQAFNSVEIDPNNGNRLLFGFPDDNGTKTAVSVSGGGTAVQAYDSVSVSGNNIVFGKTDGSTADTQPLDGLTAITDLQTLTSGHTTDITTNTNDIIAIEDLTGSSTLKTTVDGHTDDVDNLKSREQFKSITQHPDLSDNQMDSYNPTVNGRSYVFTNSDSDSNASRFHRFGFRSGADYWLSKETANNAYNTHVSGSYYDYSGLENLDGNLGEC